MTVIGKADNTPEPKRSEQQTQPFDMGSLNDLSARFASYLFEHHPEWRQFASVDADILSVTVPSPVPGRSLWITTHEDEVTVGFSPGIWHEHFNAESHQAAEEEVFASAMAIIDLIVTENILVAETRTNDDETCNWGTLSRDAKMTPPPRGRKIVLMSWGGTYDREIRSGWRGWLREKIFRS